MMLRKARVAESILKFFDHLPFYHLLIIQDYIRNPYFLRTDVDTVNSSELVFVPLKKRIMPPLLKNGTREGVKTIANKISDSKISI